MINSARLNISCGDGALFGQFPGHLETNEAVRTLTSSSGFWNAWAFEVDL